MNVEKFWPRPTGSTIVNRTLPGGIAVRNRSMVAWRSWTAGPRPSSAALISREILSGNWRKAGSERDSGVNSLSLGSSGTPWGICLSGTVTSPKRRTGGNSAGGVQGSQAEECQGRNIRSLSAVVASSSDLAASRAAFQSSISFCQAAS